MEQTATSILIVTSQQQVATLDVFASRSVSVSTGQTVMTTGSAGNDSGDVSITADTGMIVIDGDITTTSNGTENAGTCCLRPMERATLLSRARSLPQGQELQMPAM